MLRAMSTQPALPFAPATAPRVAPHNLEAEQALLGADPEAVKRATKAIGKLDGVRKVDAAGSSIAVEAELDGLHASASPASDVSLYRACMSSPV